MSVKTVSLPYRNSIDTFDKNIKHNSNNSDSMVPTLKEGGRRRSTSSNNEFYRSIYEDRDLLKKFNRQRKLKSKVKIVTESRRASMSQKSAPAAENKTNANNAEEDCTGAKEQQTVVNDNNAKENEVESQNTAEKLKDGFQNGNLKNLTKENIDKSQLEQTENEHENKNKSRDPKKLNTDFTFRYKETNVSPPTSPLSNPVLNEASTSTSDSDILYDDNYDDDDDDDNDKDSLFSLGSGSYESEYSASDTRSILKNGSNSTIPEDDIINQLKIDLMKSGLGKNSAKVDENDNDSGRSSSGSDSSSGKKNVRFRKIVKVNVIGEKEPEHQHLSLENAWEDFDFLKN